MPNAMVHPALADADEMDLVDAILARFEEEEDDEWTGDREEGWEDEDDLDDDDEWDEDDDDWDEDESEWDEEEGWDDDGDEEEV